MADNIVTGPNSCMCIQDVDDITTVAAINTENVSVIYEAAGGYLSYIPGRPINNFTSLVAGRGYIIIAKKPFDVSSYFEPPLQGGTSGTVDEGFITPNI